jgi:hypothetical protein
MTQLTLFPEPTPAPQAPTTLPASPFASAFDDFTLEQRKQIIAWNDKHTYDETIDLIQKHFGIEVSRSSLARFHNRTAFVQHVEESPHTQAAADQILLHITSTNPGSHKLTAAAIALLEQTALKLALTCAHKPAHLDTLNRVNMIICRVRNTAVRERHASVQETKCTLRSRELDLKELHLNLTRNPTLNLPINIGGTSSGSPTSTSRDALSTHHAAQAVQTRSTINKPAAHVAQTDCLPSSKPPSNSRDAIAQFDAAPADQNDSAHPIQHTPSENLPLTPNTLPLASASAASEYILDPDDPLDHVEGLLTGKIKPSWIPAEIPCDEEETFLDRWLAKRLRDREAAARAARTPTTAGRSSAPP